MKKLDKIGTEYGPGGTPGPEDLPQTCCGAIVSVIFYIGVLCMAIFSAQKLFNDTTSLKPVSDKIVINVDRVCSSINKAGVALNRAARKSEVDSKLGKGSADEKLTGCEWNPKNLDNKMLSKSGPK